METQASGSAGSAAIAREAKTPREGTDPSGTIITSPNPQLEGMSAARADAADYRTAYQSCMRRRGF